jgi:hypothetical protein
MSLVERDLRTQNEHKKTNKRYPATANKTRVRPALETTEDRNQVKEAHRSAPRSNWTKNLRSRPYNQDENKQQGSIQRTDFLLQSTKIYNGGHHPPSLI